MSLSKDSATFSSRSEIAFRQGQRCHKDATHTLLKPKDSWSCIAHLGAEDVLKSAVIEEKNNTIESE